MSFHNKNRTNWPRVEEHTYRNNDEVDALVRWALRDSVAGEEPSPEVWHRIRARLEQPKVQPHLQRKGTLSVQLSWLVQLLVLGIIVLTAFGLSLNQGLDFPSDHEYVVNGERTPQPDSEEAAPLSADDHMLSGYYLFQSARELTILDHRLVP
jgi:hypothetical protein